MSMFFNQYAWLGLAAGGLYLLLISIMRASRKTKKFFPGCKVRVNQPRLALHGKSGRAYPLEWDREMATECRVVVDGFGLTGFLLENSELVLL